VKVSWLAKPRDHAARLRRAGRDVADAAAPTRISGAAFVFAGKSGDYVKFDQGRSGRVFRQSVWRKGVLFGRRSSRGSYTRRRINWRADRRNRLAQTVRLSAGTPTFLDSALLECAGHIWIA